MLLIVAVVVAVVVMFLPTNLFLQEAGDGTFFTFQSTIHLRFLMLFSVLVPFLII